MKNQASIEQINDLPFGRAYKVTDEKNFNAFLPSVTTVLKLNQDPFLDYLKAELGPEKFLKLQNRGGDRGTVMHRWLEVFLGKYSENYDAIKALMYTQKYISETNEFANLPSSLSRALKVGRELFYNFYNSEFHKKIGKILYNEVFLYTLFRGGWAGACDFVYEDPDGKLVIMDFKSSTVPKDPDKLDNYKMQIACYMFLYAEFSGTLPDRGEIVISNEQNSDLQWITIPGDEMKIHIRKFLVLLRQFRAQPEWLEFHKNVEVVCSEIDI